MTRAAQPAPAVAAAQDHERPTGCSVTLWVEGIGDPAQAEALVARLLRTARAECDESGVAAVMDLDVLPEATAVEVAVVPA